MFARDLMIDGSLVPQYCCRVPKDAQLNQLGQKWVDCLELFASGQFPNTTRFPVEIKAYCLMSPTVFKKNIDYLQESSDRVVVATNGTITSSIVLRVKNMVMTMSGSIYELGEEVTEEELLRRYPRIVYDVIPGVQVGPIVGIEGHFC